MIIFLLCFSSGFPVHDPRISPTKVPEWGKQWYDGLRPEAPGVLASIGQWELVVQ